MAGRGKARLGKGTNGAKETQVTTRQFQHGAARQGKARAPMVRHVMLALAIACATSHAADNDRRLPTPTMSRSDCERLLWTIVDIDGALLEMKCGGLYVSKCLTAYMWLIAERDRLGRLYLANLCHYWSP